METRTFTSSDLSEDGYVSTYGSIPSSPNLMIGGTGSNKKYVWIIWPNVDIPEGSIIDSVTISLESVADYTNSFTPFVRFVSQGDTSPIENYNDYSFRYYTNGINWATSSWEAGGIYTSPELVSMFPSLSVNNNRVMAIIGNSINSNTRVVSSFERSADYGTLMPTLTVRYTPKRVNYLHFLDSKIKVFSNGNNVRNYE